MMRMWWGLITELIWKRHYLGRRNINSCTAVGLHLLLLLFFNEWRKTPKDFWAHLQNECNVNCKWNTPTPLFFQHWRHCIITPISLNLCLATNHRLRSRLSRLCNHVPGHVTGKNICVGDWKSYVTMITTHLRYKLASTGPKISFWCLFNPLNVFIFLCLFTCCRLVCITFVFP